MSSVLDEDTQIKIQEPGSGETKTICTCLKLNNSIARNFESSTWAEA